MRKARHVPMANTDSPIRRSTEQRHQGRTTPTLQAPFPACIRHQGHPTLPPTIHRQVDTLRYPHLFPDPTYNSNMG